MKTLKYGLLLLTVAAACSGGGTWQGGPEYGMGCVVRGIAGSVNPAAFSLSIQGVTVNAGGAVGEVEYRDLRGDHAQYLTRTEFFNRIETGQLVRAVGKTQKAVDMADCAGPALTANIVEVHGHEGQYGRISDETGDAG